MIAHVHVVSFSPCGGTEKVATAIGRDMPLAKSFRSITLPESRMDSLHFGPHDLVVLAFPVYGGHMPRHFVSLVSCLHATQTPLVMVAVYGNRAYEGAFLDMYQAVSANGFLPVAAIAAVAEHSMAPTYAAGRPDTKDAEILASFGLRALEKAHEGVWMTKAPGANPEWQLPPNTDVSLHTNLDSCTRCGMCARVCPNAAIPSSAPQTTFGEKCLGCSACIKICPHKARTMGNPETRKVFATHLAHAVERKEPELFM